MRLASWITKATDTLRICTRTRNTYCFSTAAEVTRTRLNITFIRTLPALFHGRTRSILIKAPSTEVVEDRLSHIKASFSGDPSPCFYRQFQLHHFAESLKLPTSGFSAGVVPSENISQHTSSCKESESVCIFSYSGNSQNKTCDK
jgi:hypothetical protein